MSRWHRQSIGGLPTVFHWLFFIVFIGTMLVALALFVMFGYALLNPEILGEFAARVQEGFNSQ